MTKPNKKQTHARLRLALDKRKRLTAGLPDTSDDDDNAQANHLTRVVQDIAINVTNEDSSSEEMSLCSSAFDDSDTDDDQDEERMEQVLARRREERREYVRAQRQEEQKRLKRERRQEHH